MNKVLLKTYLILALCLVLTSSYIFPQFNTMIYRPLRSQTERTKHCSRNTPCLFAVCEWSQYLSTEKNACTFVPSGCKCHRGKKCRRTDDMLPDKDYMTVPFICQ